MLAEAHDLRYLDSDLGVDATFDFPVEEPRRPTLRAVGDVARETSDQWLADVADLPARLIGGLPASLTLRMRAVDGSTFHLATGAEEAMALRALGAMVLDLDEWDALVLAAEADRAWPADLVRSLRARGVTGRLSTDALLDGVTEERARLDAGRLFSLRNVLARLGARLDAVRLVELEGGASGCP